jgi:hypothetical protein
MIAGNFRAAVQAPGIFAGLAQKHKSGNQKAGRQYRQGGDAKENEFKNQVIVHDRGGRSRFSGFEVKECG